MEGKWIKFVEVAREKNRITDRWLVVNKNTGYAIGEVKWHGSFRQYSYFPYDETVYERQCLLDITKFLHRQMLDRKIKREMQKQYGNEKEKN